MRAVICSFCGRPESEQYPIVYGPGVFICSDCIGLCVKILEEKVERRDRIKHVKNFVENLRKTPANA